MCDRAHLDILLLGDHAAFNSYSDTLILPSIPVQWRTLSFHWNLNQNPLHETSIQQCQQPVSAKMKKLVIKSILYV